MHGRSQRTWTILMILGISDGQVIDRAATITRVGREDQLHFQRRSAASASPCPSRLSGARRADQPLGDLDLVRWASGMRHLRRHIAEGVIDLDLGLGLGLGGIWTAG
jgi:hypothetical protein